MPRTPDRFPGTRYDQELVLDTAWPGDPTALGAIRLKDDGGIYAKDGIGVFNMRTGGSGITADQHKSLRQLIHFLGTNSPGDGFGAGPYVSEVLPAGDPFPTSETWYTDASKTAKICREVVVYNPNKTFLSQTWIVYKVDGVNPAAQAVDSPITYSSVFETGRTRTITIYP